MPSPDQRPYAPQSNPLGETPKGISYPNFLIAFPVAAFGLALTSVRLWRTDPKDRTPVTIRTLNEGVYDRGRWNKNLHEGTVPTGATVKGTTHVDNTRLVVLAKDYKPREGHVGGASVEWGWGDDVEVLPSGPESFFMKGRTGKIDIDRDHPQKPVGNTGFMAEYTPPKTKEETGDR